MRNLIISMLGGAGRYAEAMAFSPGGIRRGELTVTWEDKADLAPRRCCSWDLRFHGMHYIRCQSWGTPGGSWPSQTPQWSQRQETTHATEVRPFLPLSTQHRTIQGYTVQRRAKLLGVLRVWFFLCCCSLPTECSDAGKSRSLCDILLKLWYIIGMVC